MEGPNVPRMPPPPSGDFYNDMQWMVLLSMLDAVIPSLVPASAVKDDTTQQGVDDTEYKMLMERVQKSMTGAPSETALCTYLEARPSTNPAFVWGVRRSLASVTDGSRIQLGAALLALSTRPGSFLFTGYLTPLHEMPVRIRADTLRRWSQSCLDTPRLLAKTFGMLAQVNWLATSAHLREVSGYPDVPPDWRRRPAAEFDFLQFPTLDADADAEAPPVVVETDVVVVGSGCGGAVCAKVLAEAGTRVLVVDKGYYFPPSQLPLPQEQGMQFLYENGGFILTDDTSVSVAAGACFGGGGTVNWSASLQTQGFVRREWAQDHGLSFFETAEFQACLDRVCGFMGVADPVRQSHRGQVLLEGAHKLGWHAKKCPQNAAGTEHYCGHCHLGCGSADKQGPVVSWLPAAARAGAKFLEGFDVDRILWDESSREKRAVGVTGKWTSRDAKGSVEGERTTRNVSIKAKKVMIASGSLNSPLILKRSGLTNRHIGQNLHLHPVNFVGAFYKDDVRPWEGGIITSLCSSFEDLDGHGHGVKLEGMCMIPYAFLSHMPWHSGLDFKLAALRYRHMNGFIALTRDRDTGCVYADGRTGRPRVAYTPSAFDAAHTMEGVIALAKICYVTGANEIRAFLPGTKPFIRADPPPDAVDMGIADPAFSAWLESVREAGNRSPQTPFSSAHQMGTCRMSCHPGDGVVDARGRVWGTRDLLVADASVFPSASGVNPMVTNMAIADWTARQLVREMDTCDDARKRRG